MNRRSRGRKRQLPTEPVTLSIQRLSHDGRGIANVNGKVAFVAGALPGEKISARYTATHGQYDELDTVSVETPSPQRVEPRCPVFHRCGGCSLQHLDSAAQIEFKSQTLFDLLSRSLGREIPQTERLPYVSADFYHYRRKARLAVRYVSKKGGALVGFREKHGTFITEMDDCPILAEPVAALIKPLRDLIGSLDARAAIPQVEVAVGEAEADGEALHAALVFRHLLPLQQADLDLLTDFARQQHCDVYLQPGSSQTIHKIWPAGTQERLNYYLPGYDLHFKFHPVDFTQINAGINRRIIPLALELLDIQRQDRVLDLFCGLGNFTLALARRCREVVGVEGNQEMVERASGNASLNMIDNASFYSVNLIEPFEQSTWATPGFDRVLLDPPRSGAAEIIPSVASLGAVKLVYISCNPATLARDAATLQEHGYVLSKAGVLDMFPHTAHVESIAVFERIPRKGKK